MTKRLQFEANQLTSLLPMDYNSATASSRWLSRQSIALQLFANKQSTLLYFDLKKKHPKAEAAMLSMVSNLTTSYNIHDIFNKNHRKNKQFQSDDVILVNLLEANKFHQKTKIPKKKLFLKRKYKQILVWKDAGKSYRDIASQLYTIDGETISHEYLRKVVNAQKGL